MQSFVAGRQARRSGASLLALALLIWVGWAAPVAAQSDYTVEYLMFDSDGGVRVSASYTVTDAMDPAGIGAADELSSPTQFKSVLYLPEVLPDEPPDDQEPAGADPVWLQYVVLPERLGVAAGG